MFFNHHDLFSISTPLLFSESLEEPSTGQKLQAANDFIDRIYQLQSDSLNYQFVYLINVMACESIGVNYLG